MERKWDGRGGKLDIGVDRRVGIPRRYEVIDGRRVEGRKRRKM